jgi:uncharacterized DUF497 family protein
MRWTWDEEKDRTNKAKHGVSFETAQLVFEDALAVTVPDPFEEEERWRTIGSPHDAIDLVLLVVHTWPIPDETAEEVGRIISARKATREERRQYEEGKF